VGAALILFLLQPSLWGPNEVVEGGGGEGAQDTVCSLNTSLPLGLVPPELIGDSDPVANITAALHGPLTLLCEATGVPAPVVHWFREEEPISPGEDTYLLAGKASARGVPGMRSGPLPMTDP
jgi:hypothetical protein